jgi:hypothetical protein
MTRARALKSVIRARISKTGERYTTARRHVLAARGGASRPPAPAARPAPHSAVTPPATAAPSAKGGVSAAKVLERTGHDLDYWFGVLDRFGAADKGHTATARHLHHDLGIDGWYSQGITVAYERARGLRVVNQRADGALEVSASKVVAGSPADVAAAFSRPRRRAAWMGAAHPELADALAAALKSPASKGFVLRDDGLARYRYRWGATVVQIYAQEKPGGKTTVTVAHSKLPDAATLETRRTQWRAALSALAADLAARD